MSERDVYEEVEEELLLERMPEIIKNGFRELGEACYITNVLEGLNKEKEGIGPMAFILFIAVFFITLLMLLSDFLLIFRE